VGSGDDAIGTFFRQLGLAAVIFVLISQQAMFAYYVPARQAASLTLSLAPSRGFSGVAPRQPPRHSTLWTTKVIRVGLTVYKQLLQQGLAQVLPPRHSTLWTTKVIRVGLTVYKQLLQQGLAQVLPQPLNAFRRQGDEAFITARHHHGQEVVIAIRKFAGHGGSVPSGFAREKLRLNLRRI
jgi:hypothetical protein